MVGIEPGCGCSVSHVCVRGTVFLFPSPKEPVEGFIDDWCDAIDPRCVNVQIGLSKLFVIHLSHSLVVLLELLQAVQ